MMSKNTPERKRASATAVHAKLVEPIPGTPEGIKKRGEAEAALWGVIREPKIEAD